jgi:anti-anti-sigma factor
MNGAEDNTALTVMIEGMNELVRGREEILLRHLGPLVENRSVTLDLRKVERIDAAGISALISIYCTAHRAGHRFLISHPAPRVREILALVGLEQLLAPQNGELIRDHELLLETSAA